MKENWFLPTYEVKEAIALDDEDKEIIKEMVLERCKSWLDTYIEKYVDIKEYVGDKASTEDAIDCAKFELENNFDEIDAGYELISVDPEDEAEEYDYQLSIINQWIKTL